MRLTAITPSRNSRIPSIATVIADGTSIPAPTGGWDALNSISQMPIKNAVKMENWFPQTSWVELRKGYVRHANTGTAEPVETLMAYQGLGINRLFAVSDGSIFDVTASSGSAPTPDVTGLSSSRCQYINYSTAGGSFLYVVNGTDDPRYFNGVTWATAAITGISASDVVLVNAFKRRLFFIFNEQTYFAYLPVDSIQGAASTFELGSFMTLGGYLMSMATWTIDAGDGPEDYAVFLTSRGQAIVYRGTDPDNAATWVLIGVFNIGPPIGRRCMVRVGADVAIISIDGVIPLSKSMIYERAAIVKISLTENIQRVMNESARLYGQNFGWQLQSYPQGTRVFLNVPVQENSEQVQFVMNTITGAWCKYTNHNAACWELFNDNIYFGGNNGFVYQADTSGSDDGETITADMETAFSYYGRKGVQKRWTMCQPLINTDGQVEPGIAINVDFQNNAPLSFQNTTQTDQAEWDGATWDISDWPSEEGVQSTWISVAGIGQSASIRMAVGLTPAPPPSAMIWGEGLWGGDVWGSSITNSPEIILQVNGFNVTYETGSAYV